ncbi:MAG TPA: metallopeptidase TldD-related protein, partial [Bryobacterales bacterium]|nr:metallopeptidase TldD-related protein [Bryobacterales bacterium]
MIDLAADIVSRALRAGSADAECTIAEGEEFSANVRLGEVESVKEAGSKAIGLRVLIGSRSGSSYTSDFSQAGIGRLVDSAVALARITSEDPCAGLAEPGEFGAIGGDLDLYYDDVAGLAAEQKIALARRCEQAALETDARISNSEGGSFDSAWSLRVLANSRGFQGAYRRSSCSLYAVPVARFGDSMERDYWFSVSRSLKLLDAPEAVGREAAQRAVRRLGAVKVETRRVPVVFEPRAARTLLDSLFEAVSGESVYRHASFLAGKLGE